MANVTKYVVLKLMGDKAAVERTQDRLHAAALEADEDGVLMEQPERLAIDNSVWVSRGASGGGRHTEAGVGVGARKTLERVIVAGWNDGAALDELERQVVDLLVCIREHREGNCG